ncbi:MAG: hypothetical protein ACYC7E_00980 [Armatimonadota bacterium]
MLDNHLRPPGADALHVLPEDLQRLKYAGKPGFFLLQRKGNIELWDMRRGQLLETLLRDFDGYNYIVQEGSLYLLRRQEIVVIDHYLK